MATETPTAEQVSQGVDLTGKIALVTGANAGIGKEIARVLALRNAHVLLASRSVEKGNQAKDEILASVGAEKASKIEVLELDLSSLASIRKFGENFKQRNGGKPSLHLLINNAGALFSVGRETSADGFEAHFGVNHLGPFYLTKLLLPYLKASGTPSDPARVVNTASGLHAFASVEQLETDPKDLFKDSYDGNAAYSLSKLYNVLFSFELNRQLAGTNVVSNSLHPGLIATTIARDIPREDYLKFLEDASVKYNIPIISIPQGAATTIFAAVSEEGKTGGKYFDNVKVTPPKPEAHDPVYSEKLWKLSEKLIADFEGKH